MDKNSEPVLGIMTTSVFDDARAFRVACDCHSNAHDLDIWIEVEKDDEVHEITVTFYRELDTPWWESGFNRFQEAWNILVHGRSRFSGSLIIKAETAQHLCDAIQKSIHLLRARS